MAETKIKVAIRLRPPLPGESVLENEMLSIDEEKKTIDVKNLKFSFDQVFSPILSNKDVYKALVSDKIKHLFEGFNVTILAYGSTGSGKTFTMGTTTLEVKDTHNGLIPMGLSDIFKYVDSIADKTAVTLKASFFEIYMESIKDLLKNDSSYVAWDSKEARITNVTEIAVKTFNEAMLSLCKGVQARTTGVTAKNSNSSRSHAFFIISLTMTDKISGKSKFAKFQLVDLAGSERAGTDTSGKEFKQGVQINKGLTALGRVIASLSKRERHIPYRDSVLTRYLQDSFGGNSHTVMVTCVSPAQANVEETLSSLRYSYFAKKIKNKVRVNRDSAVNIEHLKAELERLQKIRSCEVKEELIHKIDELNGRLEKASSINEKICERILEFSKTIKSIQEKMKSEAVNKPYLLIYIKLVKQIYEELNSFVKDRELFYTFWDKNVSTSSEELNTSLAILPVDEVEQTLKNTDSVMETLDDLSKIEWIELEIKHYKNLKFLYEFLQCELKHCEMSEKLQHLLNERKELSLEVSDLLHNQARCNEPIMEKMKSVDKEIQQCQQLTKLCSLAVKKKNDVCRLYEDLEKRLQELKGKQKVSLQEKMHQDKEDSQHPISDDLTLTNCEMKLKELEGQIELYNNMEASPEVVEEIDFAESISYMNRCLINELHYNVSSHGLRQLGFGIRQLLEKRQTVLKEIKNGNELAQNAESSLLGNFQSRIAKCRHTLDLFRDRCCGQLSLLNDDTARFLMEYLFIKYTILDTENCVLRHKEKNDLINQVSLLEAELNKVKQEKHNQELIYRKRILDLNSQWESKTLILLEKAKNEACTSRNEEPNLSNDLTNFLDDLWSQKANIYELKCNEAEELQEKLHLLEEENRQLRSAQLKLPTIPARGRGLRSKKSEPLHFSMTEAFLSEEENSFTQESERLDPDYRGTPLWKRNKPKTKRKSPEDGEALSNPKPSKASRLPTATTH